MKTTPGIDHTGGPAFPTAPYESESGIVLPGKDGMDLRDWFASQAPADIPDWFEGPGLAFMEEPPTRGDMTDDQFSQAYRDWMDRKFNHDKDTTVDRYFAWRYYYADQMIEQREA